MTIENAPGIEDVLRVGELFSELGGEFSYDKKSRTIKADTTRVGSTELTPEIAKRIRASILFTGPILARYGTVSFPHPGGCVIGERPIDLFLNGFRLMGANVTEQDEMYSVSVTGGSLKGARIVFRLQSVTGTETFLMAGVLAEGTTTIVNAAMEPEVTHLAEFLVSCGAKIIGVGTPILQIEGGRPLVSKKPYVTPPDRIETGSWLVLGALCAHELSITECDPEEIAVPLELFRRAGVPIKASKNTIEIHGNTKPNGSFKSFDIRTHEYPGFPTDLQAPATVFLTQSSGESRVFETIFEGRLAYTQDLVRMGADVELLDQHRVLVRGPNLLRRKELKSPDLRAGLAFVIAAAVADGHSIVHDIYNIDRGYEDVDEKLRSIGLDIRRVGE